MLGCLCRFVQGRSHRVTYFVGFATLLPMELIGYSVTGEMGHSENFLLFALVKGFIQNVTLFSQGAEGTEWDPPVSLDGSAPWLPFTSGVCSDHTCSSGTEWWGLSDTTSNIVTAGVCAERGHQPRCFPVLQQIHWP